MSIASRKLLYLAVAAALISGCGLTQSVGQGTARLTQALFSRPITTLQLQLEGRAASNTDPQYMSALSVATRVRVYQLADASRWDDARYHNLLDAADTGDDEVLSQHVLVVKPGAIQPLQEPLHPQAQAIAVVAWVREPDLRSNGWRLVLSRDDLLRDQARHIELGDNRLALRPIEED